MLSRIRDALKVFDKKIKAVIIFGSSVYNPLKSRDIDILVVVDKIESAKEKHLIELEISRLLRPLYMYKPVDIVVMDVEMLKDNAEAGTLLSGLVLGYKILYDEICVKNTIEKILEDVAKTEEYIVFKNGRKLNLSSIAKAKKIYANPNQ